MTYVVYTRAKNANAEGKPVMLTEEVLRKFFHVPRYAAAAMLKISETTLKKACRKFGVAKWPCTRRYPGAFREMMLMVEEHAQRAAESVAEDCVKDIAESVVAESVEFSPDSFFNNDVWK